MNEVPARATLQSRSAWMAASLAMGAILFIAPLALPIGAWPWLALHFADAAVVVCFLLAAAAMGVDRRSADGLAAAVLEAVILGVFGLALGVKWRSGLSSDVLQLGLLPALDAENYVTQALQLLDVGRLGDFASRRPIAPSHFAGLFLLDGADLRLTMALLVAACGVATIGVVAALRASFGWPAAFAAMAALFAFIYPTLGTAMTESLGYMLGGAGFVALWIGAARGRPLPALAGIALFSVGVLARAGALFVLPALALWMGFCFRGAARFSLRWAGAAVAAGTVGFVVNGALVAWAAAPGQVPFANFASTFYGLAEGGRPWNHVFDLHPELATLRDADQARMLYRMAFDHIAAHPFDLVRGILVRYNDFLFNVEWHKYVPNSVLRLIVLALSLTGLIAAWRRRADPQASLLLAAFAGIFLSVPFLGDGGPRVFAASHAFTAAFVAGGMAALHRRFGRPPPDARDALVDSSWPMPSAIALFAAVPLLALAFSHPSGSLRPSGQPPSCAEGEIAAYGRVLANGTVTVCPLGSEASCRGVPAASVVATDVWHSQVAVQAAASTRSVSVFKAIAGDATIDHVFTVMSDPAAAPASGAIAACVKTDGAVSTLIR